MSAVTPLSTGPTAGTPVGELPWGSHICQLYRSRSDLMETLVPFFAAGLASNQRCLWIASAPLVARDACGALGAMVPDLSARIERGQIEILEHDELYLGAGSLRADAIVASWLEAEERALLDGYEGLRLSGNVSWLPQTEWASFSAYEEAVHRAFHGRRIIGLCSYPLAEREPGEILDLMRNHAVALVPCEGRWEAMTSATDVLARTAGAVPSRDAATRGSHEVRFFHEHDYPADRIAAHLRGALDEGLAAMAIATGPHRELIARALASGGLDVESALSSGRLVLANADEIASRVTSGSAAAVFDEELARPVREITIRCGGARIYGELADVVAARDLDLACSLALEQAWSELIGELELDLLCGYAYERFATAHAQPDFQRVCAAHTEVEAGGEGLAPAGRLVAQLRQVQAALDSEASHRARLERERARLLEQERTQRVRAEVASRHLSRLQTLTSRLSSALSTEDVSCVACSEMVRAIDAGEATLLLPSADGESLAPIGGGASIAVDDAGPASEVFREGRPLWAGAEESAGATSALPLTANGRRIGVLSWTRGTRALTLEERALFEDCARQVALALDRALLYEAARTERERAEEASRTKDEFLAMLGHELRNPLSPMLTAVELMRLRGGNVLSREREVIERQVTHMVRLVDDLLDVSRVTRGKVVLARAPVELGRLVTDALEIASPAFEERTQELHVDVPSKRLRVNVDRGRLVQVIVNLLTNASKFSPRGARVDVSAKSRGGAVSLRVHDRGIGIDAELLPHVFDLFVQGKQMADRKSGGLGLGLAIAKNLAELHGGSLVARSEGLGSGSTFTLVLPLVVGRELAPLARDATEEESPGARRILVVDDNEDAATLLAIILETWGHEVRVAHDGPAALAIAEEQRPHVALLDIGLPVMDGHELAERLAELLSEAPPKLVAVTGYGQDSDRRRSREAGFCHHLVKPVAPDHLRSVLAELV